jgi:hypothetical protein
MTAFVAFETERTDVGRFERALLAEFKFADRTTALRTLKYEQVQKRRAVALHTTLPQEDHNSRRVN